MLACQRDKFRIPDAVSYLNCAYFSPLLNHLEAIGQEAVAQKLQPWEIGVTDFFEPVERVKALFAQLVNVNDPQRIALIPSVS
ncbi:MAG: aminotransferase, partial [Bacteroidota bacterium]